MLCWLLSVSSTLVHAVDPRLDWFTLESENFYMHYAEGHRQQALLATAIAESVHRNLSTELNWVPEEKTHLVLSDESDHANGYATPLPFNRSVLFMVPPSGVGGLEDFDDWMTTLIVHEYTHVLHLDKAHRSPSDLRSIFGRFLLLFPNLFEPTWMIEGLATYKETDAERGIGRGQSSLFAAMMRAESMSGLKPVSQVNLPIVTWPGGATRYLYGVYFMMFLADEYGEDTIQQLVEAYSDNLLPFAMNSTFRSLFGKDVETMWKEFEAWLTERYAGQLQRIRQHGIKAGEPVTTTFFSNQPVRVAGDHVYYIRNPGNRQSELVRFEHGIANTQTTLTEVNNAADIDVLPEGKVLLTQVEICEEYTLYRDIYLFTEETGLQRLTECGRYVRAIWSHDGKHIIALQHNAGVFELHRLNTDGEMLDLLWRSNQQSVVSQFDISDDGERLVASVWRQGGGWNLEFFDMQTREWTTITHDTDIQAYPVFTSDADAVIYTADHDAVFNLYRFDIESGKHQQLTNVVDGAFQASPANVADSLYYVAYTANGTEIRYLDNAVGLGSIEPKQDERLQSYDYTVENYESKDYSPWSSLKPAWWFPHLVLVEDGNEFGLTTSGNDALGIHNYLLTAAYETDSRMPLGAFVYSYSNRFNFIVARSNNVLRNADGSFDRTRPTDTVQTVFAYPYSRLLYSHNFLLALAWERDFDRKLSSTATPVADFEDNLLGLGWLYRSSRRYPMSISENDGMKLRLVAEDSDTFDSDFSGQVYTLDWKQYIRTGDESVLALRVVQGWGTDAPSQFELGGEDSGISLTLLGETGVPVFGLRDYALRGYAEGLPQLRGRRAQLLSAEWRFPIQRLERGWMAPPLGLMQWSGAVFVDSGDAYNQDSADEYYTGAGIEINAELNLFYLLPVKARLGYAHGFDNAIGDDRLYLSIGASF